MKISFCITYFNQAEYVEDSLSGILEQELPYDFEVLICDDGSTDNTLEEINKFKQKYTDKIKIITQKRENELRSVNRVSYNRLCLAEIATGGGNFILRR